MDIEYPRFGVIAVDGERFEHDVVIEAGRIRARDKGPSKPYRGQYGHTPLSAGEAIPWRGSRLVIGTGASGRLPIMPEVHNEAVSRGIELIAMPTADACRLLSTTETSDLGAVLHVTC